MVNNSIVFKFAQLSNAYRGFTGKLIRLVVLFGIAFLIATLTNSGMSVKVPIALFSLFLIIEIFIKFKVEKTSSEIVSFTAAKIIVASKSSKSLVGKLLKLPSIKFFLKKCEIKEKEVSILEADLTSIFKKALEIARAENLSFVS